MCYLQGGSFSLLIADPRPPTATLTLSSPQKRVEPGETPSLLVEVETFMYTGAPVSGASIALEAHLGDDVVIVETAVTGVHGNASLRLRFPSANARDGQRISVNARWVGPTQEVLEEALNRPVAAADVRVNVRPQLTDPLPGYAWGVFVQISRTVDVPSSSSPLLEDTTWDAYTHTDTYQCTEA
jgi:hypothetical protein